MELGQEKYGKILFRFYHYDKRLVNFYYHFGLEENWMYLFATAPKSLFLKSHLFCITMITNIVALNVECPF